MCRRYSTALAVFAHGKPAHAESHFSDFSAAPNGTSAITGEIQKGHTYYRCTKKDKSRPCKQPYIREEALDAEISALLKPYSHCVRIGRTKCLTG